jgi:hypothetical protein
MNHINPLHNILVVNPHAQVILDHYKLELAVLTTHPYSVEKYKLEAINKDSLDTLWWQYF